MGNQDKHASEWDTGACQRVLEHTIGFYKEIGHEVSAPYLQTLGSGTLIECRGWRAILTARHVVSELIRFQDRIHYATQKDVLERHAERIQSGKHPLGTKIPRWDGGSRVGVSLSDPISQRENGTVERNKEPDIGVVLLNQRMAIKLNGERFYELTQRRRIEGAHPEAAEGRWSTNGLTVGSIGELDDGLCLDQDGERVSRTTVVPVVGRSGAMYEESAGTHQYQYRKLMMYRLEHERRTNLDMPIGSYAGLSGSGVWRNRAKDAGDNTTEILLSGVVIEEEPINDISKKSKPNTLVYHAGRSLFDLVEMVVHEGISAHL